MAVGETSGIPIAPQSSGTVRTDAGWWVESIEISKKAAICFGVTAILSID